jgi:Protein of unknown function (DUF1592)/Protein of unknown function (DUF1588)/Protein of unknown function (DUF1587)/Protein of unknown function (DUF1585)/Protein of unknown function (DUF1595)/Cytochrome C oxidase, cbb3-type, subunit III
MLALGSGCDHDVPRAQSAGLTTSETGPADRDAGPDSSVRQRPSSRRVPVYSRDVAPLFDKYCLNCHDSAAAQSGIILESLAGDVASKERRSLLLRVADNLRSESMPPEGEPRPSDEELETINSWLDTVLTTEDRGARRVMIRRLNRAQYNNTIRDLLGLDLHPADEFPSDDIGYGFDNIGEVLSTSPVLLEMYLAAAEKVIGEAFRSPAEVERLMNPPVDTAPRAFRQYKPPVRSPRADKIFRPVPAAPDPELARQQRIYDILRAFTDRAFRRPATHDEITRLLGIVLSAEKDGELAETALQLALRAILGSPHFLFLGIQPDLDQSSANAPLPVNDFDLAARLSYFLWSSMPDEPLERLAAQGMLRRPDNLRAQVKRMLRDPRARALAQNFAGQWLQTRKLHEFAPDPRRFPEFDESLKESMLTETEMFFDSIRDEDRSVLDFLDGDYTFVNDRLAQHYGLSGVDGDRFRKVSLKGTGRAGVLTQASVLAVTSNPTRTSPVKRGKWILENILGSPPSPPPSGVEALKEGPGVKNAGTLRDRLEQHRRDSSCASCHRRMDPLGFGLENFDATGAWRTLDEGQPIDSKGKVPGGREFHGPAELTAVLRSRHNAFARCLAEKMLTYALGRGLERNDRPAIDQIVARLARAKFRFSELVLAVVESEPFVSRELVRGNP